jgi:2-dehydropantoate 2-reductase
VRVCVLGAGGLGSVIGGRLAAAGVDVTLVARPKHVEAIRAQGLSIIGRDEAVIRENLAAVATADEAEGHFDVVVLVVKAKDTETTLAGALSLRDRTGAALSLQNTVSKDDLLVKWIGPDRVIGASTIEGGTLVGPGVVRHTATAPTTAYFGELDGEITPRVQQLVDVFSGASFASKAVDDIRHVEWEKLLQISVVSLWSVSTLGVLGGSVAQGLLVRESAEQYAQIATELLAVYRALGFEPADFYAPYSRFREFGQWSFEEAVEQMMALGRSMSEQGVLARTSLHDDLLRGRTTELDFCVGAYLAEADRLGLLVPTVRGAYRVAKAQEQWTAALGGVDPAM